MNDRYKAVARTVPGDYLRYFVVDTKTGKTLHCYDCFLWAERKAKELNRRTNDE